MDEELRAIADYIVESQSTTVSDEIQHEIVRHLIDATGCALAAVDEAVGVATRPLARETTVPNGGASAIGVDQPTSVELATLANAALVRALDYNNVYSSHSGGHPSNMFPAMLAFAEARRLSGRSIISGINVACEVYAALNDSVSLRKFGWDAGAFLAPACSAGIAAMAGLNFEASANAVALALTAGPPLSIIRSGTLSNWKGAAEAYSVMNGVVFARLAAAGMTGPAYPFGGTHGFVQQVAGPIDMTNLGRPVEGRSAIQRTSLKIVPSQWTSQGPVELFLGLSAELDSSAIESIQIRSFDFLYFAIGGGRNDHAEKWDPQTRETADHSLPYVLAVALTDGELTLDSFGASRVLDPGIRPLMDKMTIEIAPEYAEAYPNSQPVDFIIRMRDGQVLRYHTEFAQGHFTKPFSDAQVEEKFRKLTSRTQSVSSSEELLQDLQLLPELDSVDNLGRLLRQASVKV